MTTTANPTVRLVRADNPSRLTGTGTNTYIVGTGAVALIDPGPALAPHFDAILATLGPHERITDIFVTHPHLDHSALAPAIAARTGAPVWAYGTARDGRSPLMQHLVDTGGIEADGGEGLDLGFRPDRIINDGETVAGPTWSLLAIHTPGHLGSHLCFASGDVLFSGDHVMGWSSSIISPPDGDMGAYMASLDRLLGQGWTTLLPGHGPQVDAPQDRLHSLIRHRRGREAAILAALAKGPTRLRPLTEAVYSDTSSDLWPAAERNALAHLIDLADRNLVSADPHPGPNGIFSLR
ncbi:MBL fold metallo-hydrolase [Tabrizicola sp.]|uniref:MBL fold metallo-hydrolase n=1 Tax=Tabrizicola sp. TaxID=2005166 RepID=UPI00286B4476|nr:MBL fold metallo-hydrolase [Tabrizicola sp.]